MATIELLARDSDRWQTESAASAERASEVANERDGPAREVDVGMSTLADVRGEREARTAECTWLRNENAALAATAGGLRTEVASLRRGVRET